MIATPLLTLLLATPLDGVTVFAGDQPEPFQATIIDTLPQGIGPQVPMLLVRLTGKRIEHTGVIAGMSGSPVYRDGKLVGAVGYRIGSFSKEPIAGVTPIEAMRQAAVGQARAARPSANLTSVQLPLVTSGLDAAVSAPLFADLNQLTAVDLKPVAGGGMAGGKAPTALVNGGAIAVVLAHGDINLFALGTVTEVSNNQFLGFGHPMFGWGQSAIPVATAWVSTTIASPLNAFKVGRLGQLVGTMTQDRLPAIAGTIGAHPPMIPVAVELAGASPTQVQVVQHRRLTPSLLTSVVHQAARRRTEFQAGGTMGLTGVVRTTHGDLTIDEWVAHPHYPALTAAIASPLRHFATLLADNPLGSVSIKSASLRIEHRPKTHVTSLRAMEVLNPHARAGQALELRLRWRDYQDGEHHERVSLELPASLSPGSAQLVAASGPAIDSLEMRCGNGMPPVRTRDLVPWLNERASMRSRGLFVVRATATQNHGSRRALSSAWQRRLPVADLDALPGHCMIVARKMLPASPGPVSAQLILPLSIQGAHR